MQHAGAPDLIVSGEGTALWRGDSLRCAIGVGGIRRDKREGDGATPAGVWPMRRVLYRPDRLRRPRTVLPAQALAPNDGWCDQPDDRAYNRPVLLPYPGHAEHLWLEDHVYDVIVPLGYNDELIRPGLGSAIFLHVARADYSPTLGCVALSLPDLLRVLAEGEPGSRVRVSSPGA